MTSPAWCFPLDSPSILSDAPFRNSPISISTFQEPGAGLRLSESASVPVPVLTQAVLPPQAASAASAVADCDGHPRVPMAHAVGYALADARASDPGAAYNRVLEVVGALVQPPQAPRTPLVTGTRGSRWLMPSGTPLLTRALPTPRRPAQAERVPEDVDAAALNVVLRWLRCYNIRLLRKLSRK